MTDSNSDLSELTSESNFWKLYIIIRRIKSGTDTKVISLLSFILIFLLNVNTEGDVVYLSDEIQKVSGNIIGWSVSIVGFILAGYSIYSTLSDKEFQLSMSKFHDKKNGVSHLKSSHCVFIKVVVDIISLTLITYLYSLFMKTDIPMQASNVFVFGVSVYKVYLYFTLSLLQSFFVLILLMCKSFIYNVYHSIMTSIRWYGENKPEEEPAIVVERVALTFQEEIIVELMTNGRSEWIRLEDIDDSECTIYMTKEVLNQIKYMKSSKAQRQ
ncbi:hypothetical protein [Ferrimonas futtsuensis]|uniref:hypothetical protein n=1 Tax=Ferrimonas futtsuensis TaxID=364764 RepID=UPI000485CEB1|nr:hypothetical protein [Ferrimonas futtsuensis]